MNKPISKPMNNIDIEVNNVRRTFRSIKKEGTGLRSALKLLIKPEFTEHAALKGVSFQIEKGAFVGLIGANGAGKTTLLKILSGLIPPTEGSAKVLGDIPFSRTTEFRKKIALVMGQKAQLWWDLPAIDAFDLIRAIYQISPKDYKDRLKFLTELLTVEKLLHTQIRRLSLGERMKMELIGAILHWPKVIFLDEPTIGLDVLAAHKLREFLKQFNESEKTTIILTSHNMDDIERLCSRVMILKEGAMIYDGKPSGLTSKDVNLRVRLLQNPKPEEISSKLQINATKVTYDEEEQSYVIGVDHASVVTNFQKLMQLYSVADIKIEQENLEAVIQRIYGEAGTT